MTAHTRNYPLGIRDLIASIGSEVYFIDKSEGPGAYHFVHGKILSETDQSKTIKVLDKGSFSAPSYPPFSYSYNVKPGDTKEFYEDELRVFLPNDEFNSLRTNIELPTLSPDDLEATDVGGESSPMLADDESPVEVPPRPAPGEPWSEEGRKAWEKAQKEIAKREEAAERAAAAAEAANEVEEETDVEEFEKLGSIHIFAARNLETWAENAGIKWPEKFPLPWMADVYDKLLAGMSGGAGGREGVTDTKDAIPAVQSPGHKGIMPKELGDTARLQDKVTEINGKVLKAIQELKSAEEALKEAVKSKDEKAIRDARKSIRDKQLTFNTEKEAYVTALRKYQELLHRSPETTTYAPVHGGTSRDISSEGNLLRQELKLLSDKYESTYQKVDDIARLEPLIDEGRKELELILNYRKKQLVPVAGDPDSYEFITAKETAKDRSGPTGPARNIKILDELRDLKQSQFEKLPYVVSEKEMNIPVAMAFQLTGEIDPNQRAYFKDNPELTSLVKGGHPGELSQAFSRIWKGKTPTLFDLPQTFIDAYSRVLAGDKEQSSEEKKKRAERLADKYIDFIKDQIGWVDLWTKIKEYIQEEYDIRITDVTAKRLEEMAEDSARSRDSMEVTGANIDGDAESIKISSSEINQRIKKAISKPFEDRVLWVKRLQNGQENYLDKQRQDLRRLSVERDRSLEKELKDKGEDLPSLIAYVNSFSKTWERAAPKLRSKLPNTRDYDVLVTRLGDLKKYIDGIQHNPELKDLVDREKINSAKHFISMSLAEFNKHNFDVAIKFLNNFEDIFGDFYKTPPVDDRKYREAIVAVFDRVARHSAYAREILPDWKKRYQQGVGGERGLEKKLNEYNKLLEDEGNLEKYINDLESDINQLSGPSSSLFKAEEEALLEVDRATSRKADPGQSQQDADNTANQLKRIFDEMSKKRRQKEYVFKFLWNRAGARKNAETALSLLNDQLIKHREDMQTLIKGSPLGADEKASIEKAYRKVEREQTTADEKTEALNTKVEEITDKLDKVRDDRYALATELEMFTKGETK